MSVDLMKPPVFSGGHQETLTCLAWSPDGTALASGDASGVVHLWDTATGQIRATNRAERPLPVCALAWSPDGTRIGVGGAHEMVRLLEATTATEIARFALVVPGIRRGGWGPPYRFKAIAALAFSPDGQFLLGGGQASGQHLHLWEVQTGLKRPFPPQHAPVHAVSWSPDGQRFAAGQADGVVRLWEAATQCVLASLPSPLQGISSLAWSPDGQYVAAAGRDRDCLVWHGAGEVATRYQRHQGQVLSLTWSTDGQHLVSASQDQTVHLWEPLTSRRIATYPLPLGRSVFMAWSPDGQHLAAGLADQTIHLWQPR